MKAGLFHFSHKPKSGSISTSSGPEAGLTRKSSQAALPVSGDYRVVGVVWWVRDMGCRLVLSLQVGLELAGTLWTDRQPFEPQFSL